MSTQEPERPSAVTGLTALPRVEDLPVDENGAFARQPVRDAFESYRRHVAQLQAQLRVVQAARQGAQGDPTGHSIRMDALHLIRGAAEFADALERDAQRASAAQLGRTKEEVRRRQLELQQQEADVEAFRDASERLRAETLNAAKREARELVNAANADASRELREAETKGARLLEQARHQAIELTNAARAEVEQTLDWARAEAGVIVGRAQEGAEQLLRAAGLGEEALAEVTRSIVAAAEATVAASRPAARRPVETLAEETPEEQEPPAVEPERPDGGTDGAEPRT